MGMGLELPAATSRQAYLGVCGSSGLELLTSVKQSAKGNTKVTHLDVITIYKQLC